MIEWYDDKNLTISFSDTPHVCVRYILPTHTQAEKKSIEKYPFICKTELKVELEDKRNRGLDVKRDRVIASPPYIQPSSPLNDIQSSAKIYAFTIPKGYCYDGASIPRAFWRVVGAPTDNRFLIAALVHDVLCEHHEYVNNDRAFSTNVFNALLKCSDVGCVRRFLMKNSVACFQTVCCRWKVNSTKQVK